MRIRALRIQNFKRFTDLHIEGIPDGTKLVLVIGANGAGKSCLFDAFDYLRRAFSHGWQRGEDYYQKASGASIVVKVELDDNRSVGIADRGHLGDTALARRFFGRSSIRIVPEIENQANPTTLRENLDGPSSYIHPDTRFINDVHAFIQSINTALRGPIFRGEQADTLKIFQDFIAPLNESLLAIFGGDARTTIQVAEFEDATPNSPAKLVFRKGSSKINYDLLSHGEKQVVILLLNFIVRQSFYEDAILFIDEMDCHLNTALQSALLAEITTRWIPDSSQLWTASHALGFIDYARRSAQAALIDLDNLDFDLPQRIFPAEKDGPEVYEIAVPKSVIASVFKSYKLVIVENQNDELYNLALGSEGYLFLPANNSREVFLTLKSDPDKLGIRDRDYLRDDELAGLRKKVPGLHVLPLSTFENFLYHPDNLSEAGWEGFDREAYLRDIVAQKNEHFPYIIGEIGEARTHYVEFKEDQAGIRNDRNIKPIIDALRSDEFSVFYPFFNMKRFYNKAALQRFHPRPSDLARTAWFRTQMRAVLDRS